MICKSPLLLVRQRRTVTCLAHRERGVRKVPELLPDNLIARVNGL